MTCRWFCLHVHTGVHVYKCSRHWHGMPRHGAYVEVREQLHLPPSLRQAFLFATVHPSLVSRRAPGDSLVPPSLSQSVKGAATTSVFM